MIRRDDLNEEAVEEVAQYLWKLFGRTSKSEKPGDGTYLRARQLVARLMAKGLIK